MTVEEYLTSSRRIKLSYRLLRNPFILFGLAPLFLFFCAREISLFQVQTSRKALRVFDEFHSHRLWNCHEYDFWFRPLAYLTDCNDGSGRRLWYLAILCTAPV